MPTTSRGLIVACLSGCILAAGFAAAASPAAAQFSQAQVPETIETNSPANLFASWSDIGAIDGFFVDVPPSWTLESAALLKHAYRPVQLAVEELTETQYLLRTHGGIVRATELVLTIQSGDISGLQDVLVTPYVFEPDSDAPLQLHVDRLRLPVRVEQTLKDPFNRVLSFADAEAQPLQFRADALPPLDFRYAYTISCWVKTTGLNEIVLSTWNGDQHAAYPLEVIIDPAGRLRTFRGRPGEHQSIASKDPVADGAWHHVEVVNEPETGWMRLKIDDVTVDSLFTSTTALPPAESHRVVVGGRLPGDQAYFDGTRSYSGYLDELLLDSRPRHPSSAGASGRLPAPSERAGSDERPTGPDGFGRADQPVHLRFDDELSEELLHEPPVGVRVVPSDLSIHRPVERFRASTENGLVLLRWRAPDDRAREYVVERSHDGVLFEAIEHIAVRRDREYEFAEAAEGRRVAYYRLRQIFDGDAERLSSTIKVGMGADQPERVMLLGNFPNPFSAATTISYSVAQPSHVEMSVWDVSGQPVRTLADRMQEAGYYEIQFESGDLPSGTYFIRLETPAGTSSHKMILMR